MFAGADQYYPHHEYVHYGGGDYFDESFGDNINLRGHGGRFYDDSEDQTPYEFSAHRAEAAIGPVYKDYDEAMYKEFG